jgi:hypothetical protein
VVKDQTYAENLKPGNPKSPRTFLNNYQNESLLGAYLGYNITADVRILMSSWPVLRAMRHFGFISKNLNKKIAFILLKSQPSSYQGVDFETKYPIAGGMTDIDIKAHKDRRLACILETLLDDIRTMAANSNPANQQAQTKWRAEFMAAYASPELDIGNGPNDFVPVVDFDPSTKENSLPVVKIPTLTLRSEDRLESLNRCWLLIKYFEHVLASHGLWKLRFTQSAICTTMRSDRSHVPGWMLPPRNIGRPEALGNPRESPMLMR